MGCFFFQAEDGIRDKLVTGVQTCALPIFKDDRNVNAAGMILREILQDDVSSSLVGLSVVSDTRNDRLAPTKGHQIGVSLRSEERRVGKECRAWSWGGEYKKKRVSACEK